MKKCIRCNRVKPLEEFYKHGEMKDGHLNKCKSCCKNEANSSNELKRINPDYIIKERARGRNKYRRLYAGNGKANPKANENWQRKYPEKKLAYRRSQYLVKPFKNAQRHHWSYNEEHFENVIWLTKKEHGKAHRFLQYDNERKMYRRIDTHELLDTKEKHITFITECIKTQPD